MKNVKLFYIFVGVVLVGLCFIGLSFAVWTITLNQETTNTVTTSCLKISFIDDSPFLLDDAYPIKDSDGALLKPYEFTIQNNCNNSVSFQVALEILGESTLKTFDYVKLSLRDGGINRNPKLLTSYNVVSKSLENATQAYQLTSGVLEGNASKKFLLRMWLDEDMPVNSVYMNKTLASKVTVTSSLYTSDVPASWIDNGIFQNYYSNAYQKLKTMSIDEKIGQLLLVRYTDSSIIPDMQQYGFGGIIFFERDFKDKTMQEVIDMTQNLQTNSTIPLLTAVDEEGGSVNRVSKNPNLVASPFKSSKELYEEGGFERIKEDTIEKSRLLYSLGLNLNLAPVVDVSIDPADYMYKRSFGQNSELTSVYARTVITASKGTNVSYSLKHFPGYGNNVDTHGGEAIDNRTFKEILTNDIPPFVSGIEAGAEAVLVSHNTVTSIDSDNPASLSVSVHDLLRDRLSFSGVIITDALDMGATNDISLKFEKALKAGNQLLILTDYQSGFQEIKNAVTSGSLSEEEIDKAAFKILSWKYYKGLL